MIQHYLSPSNYIAVYIPIIIFSLALYITFNVKKTKDNEVVRVYNTLLRISLISTCIITLVMFLVGIFKITNFIPQILMRIYNATTIIYVVYVSLYISVLLHLGETFRNKIFFDLKYKKHMLMELTGVFFVLLMPVNLKNCAFNGVGSMYVSVFYFLNIIYWIYLTIKYRSRVESSRIIQIISIMFLGSTVLALSMTTNDIHIISIIEFLFVYILYFKMENPDLKYINELNKNKEETEKALRAKSDFLNSMNEELSEPLHNIVLLSKRMYNMKNKVDNIDVLDDLEFLLPASKNLDEIVGNILDINRLENNQIKIYEAPFNPINTIEEVIENEKQRNINEKIEFEFIFEDTIPEELIGDERHIKKIIHNLLNNAVKYTEEGKISTYLSVDQIDYETYNLRIKVSDTGIGIKNETLITLFTNFAKQTDEKNSNIVGTGLGLSITKKLVDLLQGTITVESIYGSGSTFTVTIPTKLR
ncbi:MAG: sensor histidine kinase [Bacilli bacterium]|nr:sensor histidine kinase [Bacilli bacterium]